MKKAFPDGIMDVAYGQYVLLLKLTQVVLGQMKDYFLPERAADILLCHDPLRKRIHPYRLGG